MIVFVSTNGDTKSQKIEIEASKTVGQLMKLVFPNLKNNSDFDEDNEVYVQNHDDDLDKGKTLLESGLKHGDSVFIGKCKKVTVIVSYVGRTVTFHTTPALMLRNLKEKVANHYSMSQEEVSDFQFLLDNQPIDDLKVMVGSLTTYSKCAVELTFAPKRDVNGYFLSPLEKLKSDLDASEYLSGEIGGEWGLVEKIDESSGFIFFFG